MKILGINISHDFSVCVYEDKKILDFFYESRYNLQKRFKPNEKNIFYQSIFKKINFKPDFVIYSSFQRVNLEDNTFKVSDEDIIKDIQKQLNNPPFYFNKLNHHIYHACSAFYFSGFDEAMSIIIDGGGACPLQNNYREIQSIFYIDKNKVYKLFQHLSNFKTLLLNITFPVNFEYSNIVCKQIINNVEYNTSSLILGGLIFGNACKITDLNNEPGKLMGLSSYAYTNKKFNLDYNKVLIAKEAQEKSFKETCELIEKAYSYKKIKNFVLSGGYFLNCSNNFKYVKKYPELNFFVDPEPSDGGTSIGACIFYENYL